MCDSLFDRLKDQYDDKPSLVRPRMRFHGRDSFVRCLAHVINLICSDVLKDLKAGTAKEAKKLMDDWEKRYNSNEYSQSWLYRREIYRNSDIPEFSGCPTKICTVTSKSFTPLPGTTLSLF